MQITAAIATAPQQPFEIRGVTLEAPRPGEVLVRIAGAGVCHTDIVFRDQFLPYPLPAVFGHEGSGVVEAVGSDINDLKTGDKVVLSFSSCGHCPSCEHDIPAYCRDFGPLNFAGMRPDGTTPLSDKGARIAGAFFGQSSFASHALAERRNVVKVDTSTPVELLGPLGCGIQTGAGTVMRSLACKAGSSIIVFGGGSVGLAAVMGAVVQGCKTIILFEPMASRRELALELGATHAFDPRACDVVETVRSIVPSGVDYAVDASGIVGVMQQAIACLGPMGTLGLVGVPPSATSELPINIAQVITSGLTIKGIIEGDSDPATFIPELIKLHDEGKFPFDRLIKTYPLADINKAIEAQHHGECIKVVLIP